MGFWRDLRFYLGELLWGDTTSKALTLASVAALVLGSIFVGPWGLSIFLGVLMISSFRGWRDRKEVSDREDRLFRGIADYLRGQIDAQPQGEGRMFAFADNNADNSYNADEFRKHFPPIVATMDQWCAIPGARNEMRREVDAWVLSQMPDSVPDQLNASLTNAIVNNLVLAVQRNFTPLGSFAVTPDENRHLAIEEGAGQWTLYDSAVRVDDADQAAADLNALTVRAWDSESLRALRELARLDGVKREELRDALTRVVKGNRMSRKNCDRACYASPA